MKINKIKKEVKQKINGNVHSVKCKSDLLIWINDFFFQKATTKAFHFFWYQLTTHI